jgi:hypothetical protein
VWRVELVRSQTQLHKMQAEELRIKREEIERERAATVGILRAGNHQRGSHALGSGAVCKGSGDPDYVMHYALQGQTKTSRLRRRRVRGPTPLYIRTLPWRWQ